MKGVKGTVPAMVTPPVVVPGAKGQVYNGTKAKVVVELPQGAMLFVDETLTTGISSLREFNTPNLLAGQNYYYELKAVIHVDGKPQTMTKKLIVRAGEECVARFESNSSVATAQD